MPADSAPRVPALVLGKHITALGGLRALAKRGIETYVVEDTDDVITRSRWYRRPRTTLPETTDGEELAAYLRGLDIPRAVLIPASDRWVQAVSTLPPDVRDRFPASVPARDVVDAFVDKERFRQLVERVGIPAPRTIRIEKPVDLDFAPTALVQTGFLKPTDSQRYAHRYGTKGWFVEDLAAARDHVADAATAGITFMLQEWVPGGLSETILIDGFVDRHGSIRGALARRRVRMDPPKLACTSCSRTVPMREVADAFASLRKLLAAVDYRGVFNVEFKHDARDGEFKVIELNPRIFWMVGHVAKAGLDLPWMSYLDALELPVPAVERYQLNRYGHYEVPDAAAIARALLQRRRPDGSLLRSWVTGDHSMLWLSDPLPGILDIANAFGRRAGSAWRAVAHRLADRVRRGRTGTARAAS